MKKKYLHEINTKLIYFHFYKSGLDDCRLNMDEDWPFIM